MVCGIINHICCTAGDEFFIMVKLNIEPVKQPDKIINYWKKEKFIVLCIIVTGIVCNAATVLGPVFQGKLIDALVAEEALNKVVMLAAVFILLTGSIQFTRYLKRFYIRRFANKTSAAMRFMIYNDLMNKSLTEMENENAGNLMTRAISDVDLCVEGMRKFTTEIFDTGILMASYVISLLIYDVRITLLSVLFIPAAMFLADKLKNIIYKYSLEYRKKSSEVADITFDATENALLYRVNGIQPLISEKYNSSLDDLRIKAVRANILENSMQPIYNAIAMIGVIIVIYLGGSKAINHGWTIGAFSAYITIFIAMASKASKASKLFNSVQKSQVSWKRIKPYFSEYKNK